MPENKLLMPHLKLTSIVLAFALLILSIGTYAGYTKLVGNVKTLTKTEKLDVIVGLAKPPYVMPEENTGFELELISAVLARMDISPRFIYVPLGRSVKLMDQGMGEALLTINKFIVPNSNIRTAPYITYRNVAISLSSNKISINGMMDLANNSVAAFQFAHKYLGQEFAAAAKQNNDYIEVPNQFQQVRLLLEERVKVVVMDINIFNHIYTELTFETGNTPAYSVHEVFPSSPYSMAFKDGTKVKAFNTELSLYLKSKDYSSLRKKYNIQ
ncbi:transporter substrate-binding domain-containing protein [Psychrosphaera sp.]|nr:transporter substrate-binding domain-containing protein [Psychrosphaera sp.]